MRSSAMRYQAKASRMSGVRRTGSAERNRSVCRGVPERQPDGEAPARRRREGRRPAYLAIATTMKPADSRRSIFLRLCGYFHITSSMRAGLIMIRKACAGALHAAEDQGPRLARPIRQRPRADLIDAAGACRPCSPLDHSRRMAGDQGNGRELEHCRFLDEPPISMPDARVRRQGPPKSFGMKSVHLRIAIHVGCAGRCQSTMNFGYAITPRMMRYQIDDH